MRTHVTPARPGRSRWPEQANHLGRYRPRPTSRIKRRGDGQPRSDFILGQRTVGCGIATQERGAVGESRLTSHRVQHQPQRYVAEPQLSNSSREAHPNHAGSMDSPHVQCVTEFEFAHASYPRECKRAVILVGLVSYWEPRCRPNFWDRCSSARRVDAVPMGRLHTFKRS